MLQAGKRELKRAAGANRISQLINLRTRNEAAVGVVYAYVYARHFCIVKLPIISVG